MIVGPGNAYVAEAKRQLSGVVGVASAFAGPRRSWSWPTPRRPPALAAIDLMVQAEHGPDGMAWLITWDRAVADAIDAALERAGRCLAAAERTSRPPWPANGVCVPGRRARGGHGGARTSSRPSTSSCWWRTTPAAVQLVRAAGAVFCGIDAPASLGDYAAGPNHILPTNSSARFSSALRADDFRRHIHVVEVDP